MHPPKTPLWCPGSVEAREAVAQPGGKGACEGRVDHSSACFLAVTPAHPSVRGGQVPRTHSTFAGVHGVAAGRCLGFVFSFFVSDSALQARARCTSGPISAAIMCPLRSSPRPRWSKAEMSHAFTLTLIKLLCFCLSRCCFRIEGRSGAS